MLSDTTPPDAPLTPEELRDLNLLRLDNRWSFAAMAQEIGGGISGQVLHRTLTGRTNPRGTTAYGIRQWLKLSGRYTRKPRRQRVAR